MGDEHRRKALALAMKMEAACQELDIGFAEFAVMLGHMHASAMATLFDETPAAQAPAMH